MVSFPGSFHRALKAKGRSIIFCCVTAISQYLVTVRFEDHFCTIETNGCFITNIPLLGEIVVKRRSIDYKKNTRRAKF